MKKDSGSLKMGAERTRSGFNARCLWSWLLADEDEQSGQPDASDVRRHPWKEAASFAAAAALVVAFFWYSLAQIDYRPDFSFLPDFRIRIWDGFLLTIGVSAAAMVLSLLLGILSARPSFPACSCFATSRAFMWSLSAGRRSLCRSTFFSIW